MRLNYIILKAVLGLVALLFVGCGSSDNFVFNNTTVIGDPAGLTFQTLPQRTAGTNFNIIKVAVLDSGGNVVTNASNTVTIALTNPGGANLSGTLSRDAVNGVACFDDLAIDLVGTYTFSASSPGLNGSQSQTFDVTPAGSNTITFTQQPGNVTQGTAFAPDVAVEVRDSFGNLVATTNVTITIANDPSGLATLAGTTQATTTNGVATFPGLTVNDGAGTGFTLQATAGTAMGTSAAFDVALLITRIYTSNSSGSSVTVHDINASGDTPPLRTIAGGNTGFVSPSDVAIAGNELIVVDRDLAEIKVFPLNSDGDATPTRTIAGGNTQLGTMLGVQVFNGEIYVACEVIETINVYPLNGDGDIPPTRRIAGGNTGLVNINDLVVSNNEIFASNDNGSITVYDTTDDGDVTPKRTLSGGMTQLGGSPVGLAVDGTELIVSHFHNGVLVFNTTDNGDVAPQRQIFGGNTGITGLFDVGIDGDLLYTADFGGSIRVFNLNDNGDVAPQRVISGGSTGLMSPAGLILGGD
jgi:hypothetical protein